MSAASPTATPGPGPRVLRAWDDRRHLLAGLVDAGCASLATFVVGVYAVRLLDPAALGAYALVYQAVFLAGIVPANLVFVPVEVAVVAHPQGRRLAHLPRSLLLGAGPAILAALAIALWLPLAPDEVPFDAVLGLTATGILAAVLSPAQDHVRRMLHAGGRSWRAAIVSVVQLGVGIGAVLAGLALAPDPAWIPFGALAAANFVSLGVGLALAAGPDPGEEPPLRFGDLSRGGRWLVWGGLLNPASGFVSAALVSSLAGAAALGYAEAARVVAQPVWVLAVGISFVLGPRSVAAAKRRRPEEARHVSRTFLVTVLAAGVATLLWLGPAWPLNPLAWLLPAAYVIPLLVPATIAAQVLASTIFPFRSELLGAGKEQEYTRTEVVGTVARAGVSATAPWTGAFAIPLGLTAVWAVRWFAFRSILARFYRSPAPAQPPSPSPATTP